MGRKAPRKRLTRRVMACPTGASHAPERFSALRPPLDSGWRSKVAKPGRKNAPRERDGLFDIVRWPLRVIPRPHPEERARRRRSANSKARTRVSKDEDGRLGSPSCFETHRSARRLWKRLRSSCCDAPQHEGDGARRILAKQSQAGRMRVLVRAKHQLAAVRNDRRLRSIVSGLLFTMNGATPTCRA